ncbi:hypothetical protein D3C81_1649370 [compost metagenome]
MVGVGVQCDVADQAKVGERGLEQPGGAADQVVHVEGVGALTVFALHWSGGKQGNGRNAQFDRPAYVIRQFGQADAYLARHGGDRLACT